MFNLKERQFIFKQSSSKIWNFFYDSNHRLCCCSLGRRNIWSEPILIVKEPIVEFSVDMDDSDIFHIVYQNNLGSILYLIFDSKSVERNFQKAITLLESRKREASEKYIKIIASKTSLHLFFVIEHEGNKVLSHQLIRDGIPATPSVINYISTSLEVPYLCVDSTNSFYIFYIKKDKSQSIFYNKYFPSSNSWGENFQVSGTADCNYFLLAKCKDNILHLIFTNPINTQLPSNSSNVDNSNPQSVSSNQSFKLQYTQKPDDRVEWSSLSDICTFSSNERAGILISEAKPLIFICGNDGIYGFTTDNNGINWSKQTKYPFNYGKHVMCVSYKSNLQSETNYYSGQFLPVAFVNGIKLAFYKEPPVVKTTAAPTDLREIILESLGLMKEELDLLNEKQQNLESDYSKLMRHIKDIETRTEKLEIRQNILERK